MLKTCANTTFKTIVGAFVILILTGACAPVGSVTPQVPLCEPREVNLAIPVLNTHSRLREVSDTLIRVNCVPTADSHHDSVGGIVYKVYLPKVKVGTRLLVSYMVQVENPNSVNTLVALELQLGGRPIEHRLATNVTPGQHYGAFTFSRVYVVEEEINDQVLNLALFSASDAVVLNKHVRILNQGFLQVVVLR